MAENLVGIKKIQPIHFKLKLTSENFFYILLGLIWANNTFVNYVRYIMIITPVISDIRLFIENFVLLIVLIPSLVYISKHIDLRVIPVYLIIIMVYLTNFFVFPENQEALKDNLVPFLFKALPLIFVGMSIDLKKHYKLLYYISLFSIIVEFIRVLTDPVNMEGGDMHSSYLLLPHVSMVIVTTFSKKNILNIVTSILGIFTIIAYGTRGPILCILLLVVVYIIVFKKFNKHKLLFFSIIVLSILIGFLFEQIIDIISDLVQKLGMSTRILDMFLSGDIAESSGRENLQAQLLTAISQNLYGYGIAGDRAIVGTYAHNILIEFWVSYGVIIGSVLLLIIGFFIVRTLFIRGKNPIFEDGFILALICPCFIKLFMSGSYLTEPFLFLCIGLCITENKKVKFAIRKKTGKF